ncbi:hypothetical protein MJA45_23785 [Paenibacillus aurantius]|uniref:Uncharacterized protein n=1 Tax=Paenibacillus aurantius TaxID=2918900 RepID=A0AA96LCL3_9BACL|nr:hypothetical protein [Paenibacillus aurantius]WNQ10608.1 hypothetical protein MJA45_23785 [Paenibacillus aurantius]
MYFNGKNLIDKKIAMRTPDEYGENLLDIVGGVVVGNSFLETVEIKPL